jgi:hypothetical protein
VADNITIKDGAGANVVMATDDRAGVNYSKIAGYDEVFDKLLVGTARDKLRDEFFTFDTTNTWELIQTGAGQTVTVAGAANGARYLNVATGVTINSETIILSRDSFKLPVKLAFALSMSQRIANQEVFVEIVGVNATTGVVETDATFPSTNLNNASNAASLKFDGTVVTTASHLSRGFAVSELIGAGTVFTGSTTAATGTCPNFIPASIYEINADMEEVVWNTRAVDSLAAVQVAVKRTQTLPDPGKDYKVRIRIRNLGTAPASTTDVRLHFVRVLDTTRFTVDFARHMGRTADVADSLPVAVTAALPTGGNIIGSVRSSNNQFWNDSTTAQAAAATLTGTARDTGAVSPTAHQFSAFNAMAFADQPGTMRIEVSNDNTTWRRITADVTVAANTAVVLSVPIVTRYYRAVYVNGATLQTAFMLNTSFTGA